MRLSYFLIIIFSHLALCLTATAQTDFNSLKSAGDQYLKAGNYTQAVDSFTHLTESYPKNSSAYTYLGFAYYKSKQYGPAITAFQSAYKLDPNNTIAQDNLLLCESLLAQQEPYSRSLPDYLSHLQGLASRFPSSKNVKYVTYTQGKLGLLHNQYIQGLSYWRTLAKQDPNSLTSTFIQAHDAQRRGDLNQATSLFQKLYQKKPSESIYSVRYAQCIAAQGKAQAAQDIIRQLISQKSTPYLRLTLANLLQVGGNIHEAIKTLSNDAENPSLEDSVSFQFGYYFQQLGADLEAQKYYVKAFSNNATVPLLFKSSQTRLVWLNQQPVGFTPLAIKAPPGQYKVQSQRAGTPILTREIRVTPNRLHVVQGNQSLDHLELPLDKSAMP